MEQVLQALARARPRARTTRRARCACSEARCAASARPRCHPRARQRDGDGDGGRGQARLPRIACPLRVVRLGQRTGHRRQGRSRRQAVDHALRRADHRQPRRLVAPGVDTAHPRRSARDRPQVRACPDRARRGGGAHPVLLLRLPTQHRPAGARGFAWSVPASAATAWSASCRANRPAMSPASRRWVARARSGSAPRRSSRIATSSRTWATVRSSTAANSRSRRQSPRARP